MLMCVKQDRGNPPIDETEDVYFNPFLISLFIFNVAVKGKHNRTEERTSREGLLFKHTHSGIPPCSVVRMDAEIYSV